MYLFHRPFWQPEGLQNLRKSWGRCLFSVADIMSLLSQMVHGLTPRKSENLEKKNTPESPARNAFSRPILAPVFFGVTFLASASTIFFLASQPIQAGASTSGRRSLTASQFQPVLRAVCHRKAVTLRLQNVANPGPRPPKARWHFGKQWMTCNALGNGHVPRTLRTSGIKENLRFKSQEMQLFIQLTFDMRLEGVEPSVFF